MKVLGSSQNIQHVSYPDINAAESHTPFGPHPGRTAKHTDAPPRKFIPPKGSPKTRYHVSGDWSDKAGLNWSHAEAKPEAYSESASAAVVS